MTSEVAYKGNLRTTCVHLRSGDSFNTDAPIDNNGLGEAFSPTDTVATGLASCILTMMGIKAKQLEVDLINTTADVTKHMTTEPRRISKIEIDLKLPGSIVDKERKILMHTANTCPVQYSLHPDIDRKIQFNWIN